MAGSEFERLADTSKDTSKFLLACECHGTKNQDLTGDTWSKPAPRHGKDKVTPHFAVRMLDSVVDAPISSVRVGNEEFELRGGANSSFHGHYNRDDGMGDVESISKKAIEQNIAFASFTPHNTNESRNGVPKNDPRYEDQKGKKIIVEDPQAYFDLIKRTGEISKDKKVILLYGQETDTIGKNCDPKTPADNHTIWLQTPIFFICDNDGNVRDYKVSRSLSGDTSNKVVHYKLGDPTPILNALRNGEGFKRFILAHPRELSGKEPGVPEGICPSDYNMLAFKSPLEWVRQYARPYGRGIEILRGMALTKEKISWMDPNMMKLKPAFAYNDIGCHFAFTFGRDFHYGDPGGRPAGMAVLIPKGSEINQESILDGLDKLHTVVSTAWDELHAVTIANDKYVMGSTINPANIDDLRFKVLIGGKIDRKANYHVKLWADTALGDEKTAALAQEKTVTGDDLLANEQAVSFENVEYKAKNGNAFVVEVERAVETYDGQIKVDAKAATTTIWVESPDRLTPKTQSR